jgi:hypothetical protein
VVRRIFALGAGLAVAIVAGASAAASGPYAGNTSQKLNITVKVSKGNVVEVDYVAKYGPCGEFSGVDKVHIAIKRDKFSATVHPNSETVDKLSGSFKGKNVSGTLSSSVTTGGIHPTTCKSGKVKFSAKR